MSFKDELESVGSVKTFRISAEDIKLLKWYIKEKKLTSIHNRPLSVVKAVECMVHSFCEDTIKPMKESKKVKGDC
jgi:hypothetical protein